MINAAADIPTIDLTRWSEGNPADRDLIAAEVDQALIQSGFLLVTGHGVPAALRDDLRRNARAFFALPPDIKGRYARPGGVRGWRGPHTLAAGQAEGRTTPPDLNEMFAFRSDEPSGDASVDAIWFQPNLWPSEVPELRAVVTEYRQHMRTLTDQLMAVFATALGLSMTFFQTFRRHPIYAFSLNWYPPARDTGPAVDGQLRIGAHTDFVAVTVLDREPGLGGLQVCTQEGQWVDAPYDPVALTVNIGDMLARWTGDRWHSGRHRVLPPPSEAPDEELMSLVYFSGLDHDARVETLPAPIARTTYPPVLFGDYLRAKFATINIRPNDTR